MPYVTEQLQFNLGGINALASNRPVTRQPSPLLLNNIGASIEETLGSRNSLDVALTLAKRDIRLGNVPKHLHDDLDLIPVKEERPQEKVMIRDITPQYKNSFKPSHPVKSKVKNYPIRYAPGHHRNHGNKSPVILVPSGEYDVSSSQVNTTKQNIITMRENLNHAYHCLGKPSSKKGYPDPIEEERLQRRVEEQRRHLYRMLYNTKRHVCQLTSLLHRTAFRLRLTVLKAGSVMCHVLTAYRSLLSTLHSFIRVSETMKSSYMTELKKKTRSEVKVLLDELDSVCHLLDIHVERSAPPSPVPSPEQTVPKLKILDIAKSNHKPGPVSPERDQSLRAAVRSLVKSALLNPDSRPRSPLHTAGSPSPPHARPRTPSRAAASPSPPPQQHISFKVDKEMPKKNTINKKFIKPKVTAKSAKKRRPMTAVANKARPLGKIKDTHSTATAAAARPQSAPAHMHVTPSLLEVRGGQLTPLITERELARQTWIDKLCEGDFPSSEDILGSEILCTRAPMHSPKTPQQTEREAVFRTNDMSATMVQLLDKLETIEKEEEEIRCRWLHIQYSNPYIQDTTVVLPSADLFEQHTTYCDTNMTHATCVETSLATVTIPPDKVNSILYYRRAMEQYLKLIKHHKTRDFNPWATINKMVDEIVSSVVQDVCSELLDTCDGLAENMYLSEFLPVI